MQVGEIQPRETLDALRRLLQDPNDTEQAFRLVRSVGAGHLLKVYLRTAADVGGKELLEEKPSLLAALRDAEGLAAMPEGSLGKTYYDFCQAEGLTPGGLADASGSADFQLLPPDLRYVAERLRDSHDLWHIVTGCRTDLAGEIGVLTFSTAQVEGLGVGLLVMAGYLRSFTFPRRDGARGRRIIRRAWRIGRAAEWLPLARWEELLPRPLDEVRRTLKIDPLPAYEPLYVS